MYLARWSKAISAYMITSGNGRGIERLGDFPPAVYVMIKVALLAQPHGFLSFVRTFGAQIAVAIPIIPKLVARCNGIVCLIWRK